MKALKIFGIIILLFFAIIGIKHSYEYCHESYWYYYEYLPNKIAYERHVEDSIKYSKEDIALDEEWSKCYNAKDSVKYKDYLLIFDYNSHFSMIPMTYPEGCPHYYTAQVTIYKNGKLFAKPFECVYTHGLCDEDNPAGLIKEAKGIESNLDKIVKEINDSLKNVK